eukprot:CAMPEP_0117675608 /NCGR_PEP_ID=MMETSP0804-20121206/15703_1 /TAXON_ID=1074897 /ORGANISM="Tetraselmis astigmatica, Strain CCMP880" /LENGTH=181 /DNA_ID=CAMNT_0005484637 /DNA_START=190 /DNA_END=732 /DNA_ORIENTATION=+
MSHDTLELEAELSSQLVEQKQAMEAVVEALEAEHSEELLEMRAALEAGIADTQSALLELKRSRLLSALSSKAATAETSSRGPGNTAVRGVSTSSNNNMVAGGACSATQTAADDGIIRSHGVKDAEVDFLMPTRPHHLALVKIPLEVTKFKGVHTGGDKEQLPSCLEAGSLVLARLPDGSGL